MKTITISLPDIITIKGAGDAPASLREVKTENWDSDFLLAAIIHGVSQKLGDAWSVGKKNVEKLEAVHGTLEKGIWRSIDRGGSGKLDTTIANLDPSVLFGKLSKAQLDAMLALASKAHSQ